jgi:hypothetical protein
MKDKLKIRKTTIPAHSRDAYAGQDGISIASPAYGIDFLDHGLTLQRKANPAIVGNGTEASLGNHTNLPDRLKAGIEGISGLALDDVRVHYNSPKPATLQALAYTQGREIHIGPGQERHLPHEAWHVVQQKQARVRPTFQMKGVDINADARLEKEADLFGKQAVQRQALAPNQLLNSNPIPCNRNTRDRVTGDGMTINNTAGAPDTTLQMKWIDDRTGPYYEWDTHLDGVQWYALRSDPEVMFFTIVDPQNTDTTLAELAGPENAKHRSEWVGLSGSDSYGHLDPSLILIPTEPELNQELESLKTKGQTLRPFVPQKSVYVLSPGRRDIQELTQYVPTRFTTEYIFDYENNIFATGERNPSSWMLERHPYIAREAGANLNKLAGGMLRVMGDQIFTNEASGHYGENWTDARREQFKKHVRSLFPGKPITHSKNYMFNPSDKV